MWEPGENIDLKSATILNKKEGTLYYTNKRLAWVIKDSSKVTITIPFNQIKNQQVSTQESSRIKLRLTVNSSKGTDLIYTFEWIESSKEVAKNERDSFKNAIAVKISQVRQSALARSESSNSSNLLARKNEAATSVQQSSRKKVKLSRQDIKLRTMVLEQNPDLALLHKNLVLNGLVDEEEFWSSRENILADYRIQLSMKKGEGAEWVDLAPEMQDNGNYKYTITPEIAKSIFKQYPEIKNAYIENVPNKISEKEFWRRFLASQYFNRNRVKRSALAERDSIFDECMENEDKYLNSGGDVANKGFQLGPLLDLTRTEEDHPTTGNEKDITMQPGRDKESLSLIRRFNRHSELVLQSISKARNGKSDSIANAIIIEDLKKHDQNRGILLNLKDTKSYFNLPESTTESEELGEDELIQILESSKKSLHSISGKLSFDVDSAVFESTMQQLNASILKKTSKFDSNITLESLIGDADLAKKIQILYAESFELSRHFWILVKPPSNAFKTQKLKSVYDKIQVTKSKVDEALEANKSNDSVQTILKRISLGYDSIAQMYKSFSQLKHVI
ncbi:General transcription factor IIH subunit 1 [Zancudomyces culisetae]|uniref:General transcription factor IIH subunit 1 n=1 Tax=Zancudomyces culisetae TaxID=1213189 RepID=A0A1R1PL03_ZANCU|nr:General transcription factor IIH subunit 1 [Zancudomyces culisetae]|eukprot:OMH81644.1 General transcription factor IIH subunit 1 [Zancudomyces culisetae]